MKKLVLFFLGFSLVSLNLKSQDGNLLYFCEEYKAGREVGVAKEFTLRQGSAYITVMLRTVKNVDVNKIDIKVEKIMEYGVKEISNERFDVEPGWDYIFFDKIHFPSEGNYKVSALRTDSTEIASNYVKILYKDYWSR